MKIESLQHLALVFAQRYFHLDFSGNVYLRPPTFYNVPLMISIILDI